MSPGPRKVKILKIVVFQCRTFKFSGYGDLGVLSSYLWNNLGVGPHFESTPPPKDQNFEIVVFPHRTSKLSGNSDFGVLVDM